MAPATPRWLKSLLICVILVEFARSGSFTRSNGNVYTIQKWRRTERTFITELASGSIGNSRIRVTNPPSSMIDTTSWENLSLLNRLTERYDAVLQVFPKCLVSTPVSFLPKRGQVLYACNSTVLIESMSGDPIKFDLPDTIRVGPIVVEDGFLVATESSLILVSELNEVTLLGVTEETKSCFIRLMVPLNRDFVLIYCNNGDLIKIGSGNDNRAKAERLLNVAEADYIIGDGYLGGVASRDEFYIVNTISGRTAKLPFPRKLSPHFVQHNNKRAVRINSRNFVSIWAIDTNLMEVVRVDSRNSNVSSKMDILGQFLTDAVDQVMLGPHMQYEAKVLSRSSHRAGAKPFITIDAVRSLQGALGAGQWTELQIAIVASSLLLSAFCCCALLGVCWMLRKTCIEDEGVNSSGKQLQDYGGLDSQPLPKNRLFHKVQRLPDDYAAQYIYTSGIGED